MAHNSTHVGPMPVGGGNDFLNQLLQTGGSLYGMNQGIQQARDLGSSIAGTTAAAGTAAIGNSSFKPFAVTSNLGASNVDANGGVNSQLTPQMQALSDLLRGTGQGLTAEANTNFQDLFSQNLSAFGQPNVNQAFGNVAQSVNNGLQSYNLGAGGTREQDLISMLTGGGGQGREAEVFAQLEALQAPGRERESLALENRLFSQGRGGVQTSMFGGTPEQFARNQAVEEARGSNALGALDFTQREQAQRSGQTLQGLQQGLNESNLFGNLSLDGRQQALAEALGGTGSAAQAAELALAQRTNAGQLGLGFIQGSFEPNQQLLDLLGQSANFAGVAGAGQRTGAQLAAELQRAGLEGQINAEKLAGDREMARLNSVTGILAGESGSGQSGLISSILNSLFGAN
jgi:hypothetical protein